MVVGEWPLIYVIYCNDKGQPSKQSEGLRLKYDGFTLADEGTNRFGKHGLSSLQWFSAYRLVILDRVSDLDLAKTVQVVVV